MASKDITEHRSIVILGGSYGGISVAHHVLKHAVPFLPDPDTYQVIIVSSSSQTMCRPACPRAMISDTMFDQAKLFVDTQTQFRDYGNRFKFIHGTATRLKTIERTVSVSTHDGAAIDLPYYALVIATGGQATSPLHGLRADSSELKHHWKLFREALANAKSIVIAGGGPTGVETAGELGEYLNGWNKEDSKVTVTLVSSSRLLPQLRPELARKAESYLAEVGVTLIKDAKVESTMPENAGISAQHLTSPTTIVLSDGRTLTADIFIPAFGTTPNTVFAPAQMLAEDGRIRTNTKTLRVDGPDARIYAIGDASDAARPAVHNILAQVPVVGKNIKRDLLLDSIAADKAEKEDATFEEDQRESQLVPIGTKKGVGAMMGYKLPSFLVWLVKGRDYWLWTTGRLWSGKQWA